MIRRIYLCSFTMCLISVMFLLATDLFGQMMLSEVANTSRYVGKGRWNWTVYINAPEETRLITATNDKNMRAAINEARQSLIDQGITDIDSRTLAATATAILKRKFSGRVETIASFETQSAAEASKFIDANGKIC